MVERREVRVPTLFIIFGLALAYVGWRTKYGDVRWPVESTKLGNALCLVGGLAFLLGGLIFEIVRLFSH